MGWTFIRESQIPVSNEHYIRSLYTFQDIYLGNARDSRVAYMTKRGNTYYLAVNVHTWAKDKPEIIHEETYAATVLTAHRNGEFGYKEMHEDENPFRCDAPKKLLDMLTPTDSEYAQDWRKRCADRMEENRRNRRNLELLKSLKPTDYIDAEFRGKKYRFRLGTYRGKPVMLCCDGYMRLTRFAEMCMNKNCTIVKAKEKEA